MNPLALLSSPTGVPGGGASIPNISASAKSAADSALNSSGSYYGLSSSTGNFNVGGGGNNWLMIGALAVGAFLLFKMYR